MSESKEVTKKMLEQMLANQTAELYARQAKRQTLPTGKYIQFVVEPGSETLYPTKAGVALRFACVPLRRPGDGESAIMSLKTNHMMFPPKPAEPGEDEINNQYTWAQFFDATGYECGGKYGASGKIPAPGVYDSSQKTYFVDGNNVARDIWVTRNEVERPAWIRAAIMEIFAEVFEKRSPLGNLAFFAKMATDAEGKYTNIQTSKKKGGGPIVAALPANEVYAFSYEEPTPEREASTSSSQRAPEATLDDEIPF